MRAHDLMTTDVVTLDVGATVGDALASFAENGVRHLPIMRDGKVFAVVSDRDMRRIEGLLAHEAGRLERTKNVLAAPVTSLVSGSLVVASKSVPADDLIDRLLEEGVGAIVVVDSDGGLLGIVSYVDILRAARGKL